MTLRNLVGAPGAAALMSALAFCAIGSTTTAQTPDVIVYDIGYDGGNSNDIHYWGQSGGIAAYSIATQSCNSGTAVLNWFDSGGDTRHPVIAMNMFRYDDGRIEQIGQSWLKHGFCAVNENEALCQPCNSTNCDTLGVGCADTYWATLNDGRSGGSKRFVNAATGAHTEGSPSPSGNNTIRGRLQVATSDLDGAQNPNAEYYIESQYVTADDAQAGNDRNNASYRRVNVIAVNNIDGGGPTTRERPAIYAWADEEAGVTVRAVANTEGGLTKFFFLAYNVTQQGPDTWRYEYAIQNLTSDQSGHSFTVPIDPSVFVSNIYFKDIDYHSGDPYDNTDWASNRVGGDLTWAGDTFATNPNANALRWGTLYNFGFSANVAPIAGDVNLGLFKPGVNSDITVTNVLVPGDDPSGGCMNAATAVVRNLGNNPNNFTSDAPALGTTMDLGITDFTYSNAVVWAYSQPANIVLGSGQALLMDLGSAELFTRSIVGLPVGSATVSVPFDTAICGIPAYLQGILFGGPGTVDPFQLTNAVDITAGF